MINKMGRPRSRSPICLITSVTTDRIGRHEVQLYQLIITLKKFEKLLCKAKTVEDLLRFFVTVIKLIFLGKRDKEANRSPHMRITQTLLLGTLLLERLLSDSLILDA